MAPNEIPVEPQHVLIRFSDDLYGIGDMIGEHAAVLSKEGAVWIGKFGKALAASRVDAINEQVANDTTSYFYLVRKRRESSGYDAFRGTVVRMTRDPEEVDSSLVPKYYDNLDLWGQVGVWVKLSELTPLPADGLLDLLVQRSRAPVTESLKTSVAGMFIVERLGRPVRLAL